MVNVVWASMALTFKGGALSSALARWDTQHGSRDDGYTADGP